mmetsp:Transcript_54656/g.127825  ORF Transcript_54656/g.127825 Transcript_54656/m.127825 type:complete len:208 (+) Transcript_54656:145-768(+)
MPACLTSRKIGLYTSSVVGRRTPRRDIVPFSSNFAATAVGSPTVLAIAEGPFGYGWPYKSKVEEIFSRSPSTFSVDAGHDTSNSWCRRHMSRSPAWYLHFCCILSHSASITWTPSTREPASEASKRSKCSKEAWIRAAASSPCSEARCRRTTCATFEVVFDALDTRDASRSAQVGVTLLSTRVSANKPKSTNARMASEKPAYRSVPL